MCYAPGTWYVFQRFRECLGIFVWTRNVLLRSFPYPLPPAVTFGVDDFPFPKVGYVCSLEGITINDFFPWPHKTPPPLHTHTHTKKTEEGLK